MRDIHNGLKAVQTLDPKLTIETRHGAPVDGKGFEAVEHLIQIGVTGETLSDELFIACALEASDDGTSWLPVAEAHEVLGTTPDEDGIFARIESAGDDLRICRIGYVGPARYTRISVQLTGTHEEGTPVSALALLGYAHLKPVA
jgi:hypothetical protein